MHPHALGDGLKLAKRTGGHEYTQRAARSERSEPHRDVTPPVRAFLEREGIAGDGKG